MTPQQPIRCDLHDHLEVACLYGYELRVSCNDQTTVTGQAVTTSTDGGKEFLVLKVGEENVAIPMNDIESINVLTANARFSSLTF